jgi:hypothetical protein
MVGQVLAVGLAVHCVVHVFIWKQQNWNPLKKLVPASLARVTTLLAQQQRVPDSLSHECNQCNSWTVESESVDKKFIKRKSKASMWGEEGSRAGCQLILSLGAFVPGSNSFYMIIRHAGNIIWTVFTHNLLMRPWSHMFSFRSFPPSCLSHPPEFWGWGWGLLGKRVIEGSGISAVQVTMEVSQMALGPNYTCLILANYLDCSSFRMAPTFQWKYHSEFSC